MVTDVSVEDADALGVSPVVLICTRDASFFVERWIQSGCLPLCFQRSLLMSSELLFRASSSRSAKKAETSSKRD